MKNPKIVISTNHVIPLNKGILLLGPAGAGKSRLMNLYVEGRNSVIIQGKTLKGLPDFLRKDCNEHTEIIVFDDLPKKKIYETFNLVTNGIVVQKAMPDGCFGYIPFQIHPKIIITSNCLMKDLNVGISLMGRFDIFELSGCT